jgi:hypothetical protein
MMSEQAFLAVLDRYFADVRAEAAKLFNDGCAVDQCCKIAMAIVEARDLKRAQLLQQMGARSVQLS